jgi:hypothetical protein
MCSGEVYYLSVEQLKCVVAEGRQEVEDCRNIFVDKVRKALVFLDPRPSFAIFGGALMCGEILGAVITNFLGFRWALHSRKFSPLVGS